MGSIRVRLGEGRTAEVLRNLCWQVVTGEDGPSKWSDICSVMEALFGSRLEKPQYIPERGEIVLTYRTRNSGRLDISCTGRGEQQTLLLLSHMAAHPGAILLLDEPGAHLEILRQRQIYNVLSEQASKTGAQVIAASHSEVLLNEAATRDIVVAFVGRPHRIDNRGSRVRKALTDVSFDQYYQAEQTGWILYIEGSTDLHILRTLAKRLSHPAEEALSRPFVQYVGNQPRKAQEHFHALREAKSDLLGLAIYDRLEQELPQDPWLKQHMWSRRELENYICQRETLLSFAESRGQERVGPLFGSSWRQQMEQSLEAVESALRTLGKNPWGDDIKASDEFLAPLFQQFYDALGLPNEMMKSNFHLLAAHVAKDAIHPEIVQVLDSIHTISRAAHHAREGDTAAT